MLIPENNGEEIEFYDDSNGYRLDDDGSDVDDQDDPDNVDDDQDDDD